MKDIIIYTDDIIPNAKYMNDDKGRLDLLGQLLFTGYGINIPYKTRTPQDLNRAIKDFVICVRGYCYCNTPLTLSLLAITSLPGKRQLGEANKILNPKSINLIIANAPKPVESEPLPEGEVSTPYWTKASLSINSLARTSWYTCSCGHSSTIASIQLQTGNKLACLSCHSQMNDEYKLSVIAKFPHM